MQKSVRKINLVPREVAHFECAQSMTKCDEDHRRVAQSVATALLCRLDQSINFLRREVLAWPAVAVWHPARRNTPIFDDRGLAAFRLFMQSFHGVAINHSPALGH